MRLTLLRAGARRSSGWKAAASSCSGRRRRSFPAMPQLSISAFRRPERHVRNWRLSRLRPSASPRGCRGAAWRDDRDPAPSRAGRCGHLERRPGRLRPYPLAVIDLSPAARQPMTSADASVVITYNGEVYNFADIRHDLAALGYPFRSRSDTEVIVNGWHAWGARIFSRLRGMFALALWD